MKNPSFFILFGKSLNTNIKGLRFTESSDRYHSEASPGPLDNTYLFDRFIEMVRGF